jgi:hypothetical protein
VVLMGGTTPVTSESNGPLRTSKYPIVGPKETGCFIFGLITLVLGGTFYYLVHRGCLLTVGAGRG